MSGGAASAAGSVVNAAGQALIVARLAAYHHWYDGPSSRTGERTYVYKPGAEMGTWVKPSGGVRERCDQGEHCLIGDVARAELVLFLGEQLTERRARAKKEAAQLKAAQTRAKSARGKLASGLDAKKVAQRRAGNQAYDSACAARHLADTEADCRAWLNYGELVNLGLERRPGDGTAAYLAAKGQLPTVSKAAQAAPVAAAERQGGSCWLWISGDTYPNREAIKACGARWSGKRQAWYIMECCQVPAELASLSGLEFKISGSAGQAVAA